MTYSDKIAYIAGFYGLEAQLVQTAEECAELAQAALKFRKALPDDAVTLAAAREHLIEEMADDKELAQIILGTKLNYGGNPQKPLLSFADTVRAWKNGELTTAQAAARYGMRASMWRYYSAKFLEKKG